MNKGLKDLLMIIMALALFCEFSYAADAVRVLSNLDGQSAKFEVNTAGSSDTQLKLEIPAIALRSVELNSHDYKEIELPVGDHLFAGENAEDGKPSVPSITTMLAIPDRAGVTLTVNYSGYDDIENIDLAPVQPSSSESNPDEILPFAMDQNAYSQDAFYPGPLAEAGEPFIMRDVRGVQISLYPAQYNPARKILRVYRDLSVSVSYDGEVVNPKTTHHRYMSEAFYPIYRSCFANFDQLFSTAEFKRGGLLIISKPVFIDSLAPLALWKHRKGYTVHLAPTTEVVWGGNPTSTQVFNYIQNAYNTWDPPPDYVIIVGDKDNLALTGVTDFPYNYYTSDHHYTMVDGTDYIPDLMVSRLSVDNMAQFRIAAAKVLAYDRDPFMEDPEHWIRGLTVAENVIAQTPRITVLWVRQLLLGFGFASVDTSICDNSGERDPLLPTYFNRGVSFISYRGWSGGSGWYCPTFVISDLNALQNNNKLAFMASGSCGTGDFGDSGDPCFGETWIRMGASPTLLKGGPVFYGTSDHNGHTKWNNPMMVGLVWGILHGGAYHFGQAIISSKMQLYRTFPRERASGGIDELYFHSFNGLGDPEVEIRTRIPLGLMVSHPQALPLGANFVEIDVTDSVGTPIDSAYVTLQKGYSDNEEVFVGGRADASGHISFQFEALTADTMFVTVFGKDLYPYQGHIIIAQADLAIAPDSIVIDDDDTGYSSGNSDGLANPGEQIELNVSLKNFGLGQTASGITTTLEAIDNNLISIFDPQRNYPDISPGQSSLAPTPFVIKISDFASSGDNAKMKLVISDGLGHQWNSAVTLPIQAPKLVVNAVNFSDPNQRLDPGDSIGMILTLANMGGIDCRGVNVSLSTQDDYSWIESRNIQFGDILRDSSVSNSSNPIMIKSDAASFNGRVINLFANINTTEGYSSKVPFIVSVGNVSTADPVGHEAYGYYMYDDTDIGYAPHPAYQWIEIVPSLGGSGTRLVYGQQNDDNSVMVELPFDLVYYGNNYSKIIISINGVISVDTTRFDMAGHFWYNFYNWPIPDPATARAQISAFWDDIAFTGNNYGVYVWPDTANHRFIVEWYHMYHRNTNSTETFEMIIDDPAFHPTITGDAEITFQYNLINNNDISENYSTVGFEDYEQVTGIQYEYDNFYAPGAATLANNRAIKITTNTGRGAARGHVELNNGGDNGNVLIAASSGQKRVTAHSGEYWMKDIPPGTVNIRASIRGYFPFTISGIQINPDITTTPIDFNPVGCPVPSNIHASDDISGRIEITWNTINHGLLTGYNIYRSRWLNGEYIKLNVDPIQNANYIDMAFPDTGTYWYYATATYSDPDFNEESLESMRESGYVLNPLGIEENGSTIPHSFFLSQNFPNPFNPTTTIEYGLIKTAHTKIDIFDILGRLVHTIIDQQQQAGYHRVYWNAGNIPSGIYFYKIKSGDFSSTKKMLLLK